MNSARKRHSFCSRRRPLRSRAQSTRGRKFIAPSLSVSASPWRQRERRKWRCAPISGEDSRKVTISAAVPARRKTGAGPWRLLGDAQRCESEKREALWLVILFLKASGTTSHVCSSQSIREVASNLKATCSQSAQWTRSRRQRETRIVPPQRRTRSPWCWNRTTDQLVKKRKTLAPRHLLLSFVVFGGSSEVSLRIHVVLGETQVGCFSHVSEILHHSLQSQQLSARCLDLCCMCCISKFDLVSWPQQQKLELVCLTCSNYGKVLTHRCHSLPVDCTLYAGH